ncbi:MAG: IS1595 family transposase [Candidatus Binataceae bacterium]|jgi:transposase-like protein
MNTKQMTFRELLARFPDERSCKAFLELKRWPDGTVKCPRCGEKAYKLKARPFHYLCKSGKQTAEIDKTVTCDRKNGYRFSVITRTVFENTNYPLREWFRVIFLMFHSKKGMSAHQIHRMIGTGSYETAWYLCTRIRAAMKDEELSKLIGEVEADETYIGGKEGNKHLGKRSGRQGTQGKIQVIGVIARKGNVVCKMLEETGFDTHEKFVRNVISNNVSLVATDEAPHYRHLGKDLPHEQVNHAKEEYVRGRVHTQSIESFWSLLKRGIIGNYHKVSAKYLPLYLNEFTFRFNNRKNPDIFDAVIAGC